MSHTHCGQNEGEVRRIMLGHPREERTVLRNNRLLGIYPKVSDIPSNISRNLFLHLGCLSPLRAFGDGRFKLSFDQLNEVEGRMYDLHHQVRKL